MKIIKLVFEFNECETLFGLYKLNPFDKGKFHLVELQGQLYCCQIGYVMDKLNRTQAIQKAQDHYKDLVMSNFENKDKKNAKTNQN